MGDVENGLKKRDGDQHLPVRNNRPVIQQLVIDELLRDHTMDQPPNRDVRDALVSDIWDRLAVGIQRYGTGLQPHNGRDVLRDAYEEALDLAMYLRQAVEEGADDLRGDYMRALVMAARIRGKITDRDDALQARPHHTNRSTTA